MGRAQGGLRGWRRRGDGVAAPTHLAGTGHGNGHSNGRGNGRGTDKSKLHSSWLGCHGCLTNSVHSIVGKESLMGAAKAQPSCRASPRT